MLFEGWNGLFFFDLAFFFLFIPRKGFSGPGSRVSVRAAILIASTCSGTYTLLTVLTVPSPHISTEDSLKGLCVVG